MTPDATGVVTFPDPYVDPHTYAYPSFDLNPANNRATVVINPTTTTTSPSGSAPLLPVTGTRTAQVAVVGGVPLVAGVALLLVARRRRVALTTPADGTDDEPQNER